MSDTASIFVGTELSPAEVARSIAAILGGETDVDEDEDVYIVGNLPGGIAGEVSKNFYASLGDVPADERSVWDGYSAVWDMHIPSKDESALRVAARTVFDRLVAAGPPWPVLLAHNHTHLIAAAAPGGQAVEFPTGTLPEDVHRDRWSRFDLVAGR